MKRSNLINRRRLLQSYLFRNDVNIMKIPTHILVLLLLFVLPLLSKAQQDSIVLNNKTTEFKNQFDLDVQFLGVDFLYKHRIDEKLFLGGGFGGGFIPKGNYSNNGAIEVIRFKLTFTYRLSDRVECYIGGAFSPLSISEDNSVESYSILLGFFYRVGSIYIGLEPSYINTTRESFFLTIPLPIIKIPLKKW